MDRFLWLLHIMSTVFTVKLALVNQHQLDTLFLVFLLKVNASTCFERYSPIFRLTVTCLRLHSNITQSSAQGISKGASGAVDLAAEIKGQENGRHK
jgi:hypothetical protein